MEARTKVRLRSLEPYRYLFPRAQGIDKTIKRSASVSDTVQTVPKIAKQCSWQVEQFVNHELRGLSTYDACSKLWHFVKYHIAYEKDESGIEQVRSPRRLIHDKKGDCDCYTTFIDSCLYVLKIPFINRITKYGKNFFQHIYPIVPTGNGKYITMDCVVGRFNYEEPYTEKKDYTMDLQILDGIDDAEKPLIGMDAQDLFGAQNELDDLGRLFHRTPAQKARARQRRKNFGKKLFKAINKINKFNPATILLRAGLLISMKENLMRVATTLRWAYATPEFAKSRGMDMSKYAKLKSVLAKLEKIFYGAGGSPENLKKAILNGRGNRHHEVSGPGDYTQYTPAELLGEIFDDEFGTSVNGPNGLGELGIVTAAAVAAATGAVGTLAALLKSIGNLFPKKNGNASNNTSADNGDGGGGDDSDGGDSGGDDSSAPSTSDPDSQTLPDEQTDPPSDPGVEPDPSQGDSSEEAISSEQDSGTDNLPAPTDEKTEVAPAEDGNTNNTDPSDSAPSSDQGTEGLLSGVGIKAFYENNKKWIWPVGIGVAAVGAILLYNHFSNDESENSRPKHRSLNGLKRKKHKKRKGGKGGGYQGKKSMIALM